MRGVPCNIPHGPKRLLCHNGILIFEQLAKNGDSALIDNGLSLEGVAGGDIGERPGGLELQMRVLLGLHELDQRRDQVRVDDRLDRRDFYFKRKPTESTLRTPMTPWCIFMMSCEWMHCESSGN